MIKLADTLAPMADFPAVMAEHTAFEDGETLQEKYETGQLGGGGGGYTQLSQAEYDALSDDEKMNGKEYRTYDTGHIYKLGIEYGKDAYFTSLSQLGLTAPTTVGEVFMAMPEKSMLMLNVEALADDGTNVLTVTDAPKEFGVLTIEKWNNTRFRIEFNNSLGGSSTTVKQWIGTLKGNDGTGLKWKQINTGNHKYTTMGELGLEGATATIQDVMDKVAIGDSVMLRTDAFNNDNWKTQCNGIQWGYLKIEKTMNGLSNIELQEVITPNRRYFGTQSSGKFVGWVETTGTKGLVSNAQNFKLDITKNNASWYGFFKLEYLYGTELCQVDVGIANTIDYKVTKGTNYIDKITYTVNGANIVLGIDFIGKVYGVQVVEMPIEFGVVNSLTAEQFTGDTTATISTISEEPIILRYNMPETFSYSKYGITHNNTITEVVRAIGNYYASKYDNQNITLQVIISTNYNSSTFNKSLPCNGRSSITTITYMPYKFASRVKIETMNTHTGETYLGSLNDSETDDIVWKQIATKTYNSVAELNRAKGTNIELVNGEDNTQKIVDALSVGEQFASLYHNNANQNRFGIDVSYGNLIHELRITKCLDADLTANYATVTAFMNTGCVMSRIYYKTYSTDWSSTKDYVDNAVSNSGNTFNGKEVKSITIDLSASAFQVKGTSLYKIALDNYISANTNVIKVEGYYVPPTDANSTYKDKRYIVHTSDSDRAGGIRYYDGSWTTCVCQSESGSKKGSGYAKIYYIN